MRKALFIGIGILGGIFIIWWIATSTFSSWDFRNNLWAPANLLLHGKSAYAINTLFENSNAVWFPQLIGLFFPLGLLSQYQAATVWLLGNITIILFLIWNVSQKTQNRKPTPLLLGLLVLIVFLFPPTFRLLLLGQVDVIIVSALLAGTVALERRQWALGSLLYAIALGKPQLCVLVLPGALGYLFVNHKGRKDLFRCILYACLFVVLLTIPLWVGNLNWPNDFLKNLRHNPQWSQPSLYSQLNVVFGQLGILVWAIGFAIVFGYTIRMWLIWEPSKAVLWSLALTTVASPYIWSWDYFLLIPLILDTAIRIRNGRARIILLITYCISIILFGLALMYIGPSDNVLWWFPLLLLAGIVGSLEIDKIFPLLEKKSLPTN
jgi:hypothetical protein